MSVTCSSFTGWNTKPDNTGAGYADKAEYHVTGDVTMYAQWKADKASLVYNANGGTGGMDSVTGVTDQKVAVNENGFTYKGHRFAGWNSMPDGTGDTYNPGDEYTLPAGVGVLYAQWEEIPASLTYDGNGSDVTGETAGYTGIAEDTPIVSENGFDRPGHEFKGWNTKPDGTGDTLQPGDTMTLLPEGDTILYAQWDELPATVTYDPNGGTGPPARTTDSSATPRRLRTTVSPRPTTARRSPGGTPPKMVRTPSTSRATHCHR